jgi:hypothetical protein
MILVKTAVKITMTQNLTKFVNHIAIKTRSRFNQIRLSVIKWILNQCPNVFKQVKRLKLFLREFLDTISIIQGR